MTNCKKLELDQFLPYRTVRLAGKLSEAVSAVYKERFNLTIAQWRVLATLGERTSLSAKEIGHSTAMDKVKVSRAVQELVARKLVQKDQDKEDKRAYHLSLTPSGQRLYDEIVPLALNWQTRLLGNISERELAVFMNIVSRLEGALDTQQAWILSE